jgi:tRNA/rRNA methyltransferase
MGIEQLEQVRIVLVEPAGARNVGAIARVMKNMGLQSLVLVNPQCDPTCDEARHMAVHAQDLLAKAAIVQSLPDALQGCYRAIATTGRQDNLPLHLERPQQTLPWLLDEPSALIFGREDSGLTNLELNYAQRYVGIETNSAYASMNLAQAVGICVYELRNAALSAQPQPLEGTPEASLAPLDYLERYLQQLETSLLEIGYLYPHTVQSRMAKFRQIYKRAMLSKDEVDLLWGILGRIKWLMRDPE